MVLKGDKWVGKIDPEVMKMLETYEGLKEYLLNEIRKDLKKELDEIYEKDLNLILYGDPTSPKPVGLISGIFLDKPGKPNSYQKMMERKKRKNKRKPNAQQNPDKPNLKS